MGPSATVIARTIVDQLVAEGVREVVISPGSRSAPLSLAAAARPELRLHVRIDERGAGFLAVGIARAGGDPVALICSSGTATANYHPAVLEADAAGVPLLVLTADRPPELRGVGANQTIAQANLYGEAVRWDVEVDAGAADPGRQIRAAVRRAVLEARGRPRPPGPVHLNVPLREPLLDADDGAGALGEPLPVAGAAVAEDEQVGADGSAPDPVELLGGARRGVVIAGEAAVADRRSLAVAQALGYPVLAEPTSGLRVGAPALRMGHWLAGSAAFLQQHRPDVVVQLGRPVLSRPVLGLLEASSRVIACDPLGRRYDPAGSVGHFVDADFHRWAAPVAEAAAADGAVAAGWAAAWSEADRTAGRVLDDHLDASDDPSELGMARDLAATVPDGGCLVAASSLPIRHLNETMPVRPWPRVVGNRGVSGIDGFVSTAVGVALAHDGPTAALAGDLSIVHDLTGLVIGPDEPAPSLPIVVLNNGGGGIFHLLPYGDAVPPATFRRLFTTPHELPLEGVAITMGVGHTVIDEPAELARAVADAWATQGITLLEVVTDTPTQTRIHHELRAAIDAALAG